MKRVAIIGNAGGGKSTLARKLAAQHALPYVSVDQLQWRPGWIAAPESELSAQLDQAASQERWSIDGWGPWASIHSRLHAADTIIFVDLPLWMHFWLAAERQISAARGDARPDPIEGCDQLDVTERIFETIWRVHNILKPRLEEVLAEYVDQKAYFHITKLKALAAME